MPVAMLQITDEEFASLIDFVKVNFGLDLTAKKTFVQMRLQRLVKENHFSTFAEYFDFVCRDISGVAVSDFINGLTVNYTLFYRESFHFDVVAGEVLPYLFEKEKSKRDLRIWSAGCSTGEEPYTLAIIVADFLGINRPFWDAKILATDISTFALQKALVGAYAKDSIKDLNPCWAEKYFIANPQDPDSVVIAPNIKEEVIFRKLNLVKDPFVFKQPFHFIFCRNVMIYFDEETRLRLVKKFYDVLDDGGYLFIGMSETIDHSGSGLEYVMPSVYRKVAK